MTIRSLPAAALLTLTLVWSAWAEPYVVDKSHAHVGFQVSHLGFSTVHGVFHEFDAEIDFDPGNVESTRVNFVIDVDSVDTRWKARDDDLKSKNFFEAATFPTISFRTTEVIPTGATTADVTGDLTIKGVTQPVTLQATLNKIGPSPFDASRTIAGFSVEGQIDRRDFDMGYAAPAIGAEVTIRVDLEMSPAR